MSAKSTPPEALLVEFDISSPSFVEETAIAEVWKVRRADGQSAALKIYKKRGMGNESTGFSFLKSLNGNAAVNVYRCNSTSALMEWLDGHSLGDLTRCGEDQRTAKELVAVANRIHRFPPEYKDESPKLEDWFEALFSVNFAQECPPSARKNVLRCQNLARQLIEQQHDIRPLHGDLHHDNIRLGERGYCAFDAKGILGERTYELANAFRNPKGATDLVCDVERVRYLCNMWSKQFEVEPLRLMQWAVVKSSLSIVWRCGAALKSDPEFNPLELFLSVSEEY